LECSYPWSLCAPQKPSAATLVARLNGINIESYGSKRTINHHCPKGPRPSLCLGEFEAPAAPPHSQTAHSPTARAKPTAQGQRAKGLKHREGSMGERDSTDANRRW
jgi:hypothetical protein